MSINLQPTILPYNKNDNNLKDVAWESIFLDKSLFEEVCVKNDVDYKLLILAATSITLTKYTNTPELFIRVNDNYLILNDKNRKDSIIDYIIKIKNNLKYLTDVEESYFRIFCDDFEDGGNKTTLIINEDSLKLKFNPNLYTNPYIQSFLRSIKKVIIQFKSYGLENLKIEDIQLRYEQPVPQFKLIRNPLVNELLEEQASKTPDKIALRTCGESYTFREVNDEANKIANALIKRGIEKGTTISFLLERNKTLITTFLGIIKAGCVANPLDMNFPIEKINYIRCNSDSQYVITYESIDGAINPQELIDDGDSSFPNVNLNADDPIFLLYTSGSTGNPKGVVLTHCGISNLVAVHIKNNYKKLLSISSIAFDISEEDILVALTHDKELIFANDDEINDIVLLSNLIQKTKPEFVNLTPSRLLSYVEVPEFSQAIKVFKGIGCGGEQFTKKVYESIKKYVDIDIYNGYGPLETSLTSNSKKIENPDFITNGKPLLNYITDVRDIDGKLLPYGVVGELYIGGVGVSKGYYKLEEKTKEAFISINDVPYYKSGDYAIQLPSNEIIIKGRVDNQVKLRGQRVNPEEIEQVILKYGNIGNAIVTVHELNQQQHLCAYFTSKISIDIDDLRYYLSNQLSSYMVPTFFIQLDRFPETSSGKIDRKMLPKPEIKTKNDQPIDDFERKLHNFCSNILNYNNFGVTDNLFKLGFTSLTLMKLNSDIYHEFNISLKHTDLMDNPTIRDISKLLHNSTSINDIEKIEPTSTNKYPMSSQQKRLYVIHCQNPMLTNYNLPNVRKYKNFLDIKRLEDAVNKVIDCEEILRTSFHVENGEYIQQIHNNRHIRLDLIKLDDDNNLDEVLHENIRPFNLETEPLIRIKVIEFRGETYVFRDMHHIIADQISNDLLYDKIKDAYNNKTISPSMIQYKDYVYWVEKQLVNEADYWKNKEISDFGTELFCDFKRHSAQTFNGNKIAYPLDKKVLERIAKDNNTTIYKLLLSQFIILLHKYTNDDNIQIGTVTSGRTHPDLEKVLGMFVNTLPFIQSVSAENTVQETLINTEKEISNLFNNQNYSIERIIEDHKISTDNSHNPLFSIAFIQNTADNFDNDLYWGESKFDLTFTLKDSLSQLTVEFEYNQDLYTFEKANDLLAHYVYLIDNISQNMDKKIRDIKILSSAEEDKLIEMSGFDSEIKTESILVALARNVEENPTQIILSDDKSYFNYKEFDSYTNSLANYLKDNFDVKQQDNIVLIANRSVESVLGFYSILKLNAVYVPINPFAPKNRIKHIIEDVNAKLVLSNIDLEIDDVDIVNLDEKSIYDYDNGEVRLIPKDNLCILHTSGTTGLPKGVQITHENFENFIISAKDKFYDKDTKIFYHTTNIGFDTSLFEIIFSISMGIQLHVINEDYVFSKIPKEILNQKSMINTVPTKLKMFLTLSNFDNVMKNVNQLILAGEALSESLVSEIQDNYNPKIYDAYGPCEATIFATIKEITSSDELTIGKSNINTHVYILNDEKQLCPVGIPGELCIGGKQVSNGYLNKIQETNNQFIENPFGAGKLYCTGDLAYLDRNGEINFIGRRDSQIKINGQRIEISEINKQIEKYDDIVQAVTILNFNKTQLYSYIVAESQIDIDDLSNYLAAVLLPFMIPSSITQIDSIPVSYNGKIDTNKLPEPKVDSSNYAPPTTDIEKSLVKVWEDILDVERVGINDNFYHLGGDSIKAIRIVSILQNEGIHCNPHDILNYKTPYLIAKNIDAEVKVSYDSFEGIIDLLPIQNYFFDEIKRNNYTQEFILESKCDLDSNIVQKSLDELTNLHDMLRASFKIKNGKIIQEILPLNTKVCKINELEVTDINEIAEIVKNAKNSIDVFNRLIDVSLIHYEDKCYVIFVIHHLIIDGVSWGILLDDLAYIYTQLACDHKISIARSYSYKNWVGDVKRLADNISQEEKQHWIEVNNMLDDCEIKGNATKFNFNVDVNYDMDNLLMLSEEEYWALAIARAYKKTFGKDIIFNRESHGRDESLANLQGTVGWFTTQYPVPVNINNDYDDISLIRDVYKVKTAFREVNNLGLNYTSLIYIKNELEYKYCPVTFNFLSTEFIFENNLFKSINQDFTQTEDDDIEVYGVDFNINRINDIYSISGDYPQDTYIGEDMSTFIENIKFELEFIGTFKFKDGNVICSLSQSQLEVYFNEKDYDMGTAYSTWEVVDCLIDKSIDEIKYAIYSFIDRHPILKGRILDDKDMPLLICDSYPLIEVKESEDYSSLIREFDLEEYLARFYIIYQKDYKCIFYDIHHIINDAVGFKIIKNDLNKAFNGNLDISIDLGFVYASRDSFEDQFKPIYKSGHEFYQRQLADINEVGSIKMDLNGSRGMVSLPIHGVRTRIEELAKNSNVTVGTLLNAIFAYAYSRFIGSTKVYFNFVEHGRHETYNQDSLGMFARTIPILVDCKYDVIKDYLTNFSELTLNSMSNVYPYRLLANEFNLNNDVLFEYNLDLNDISYIREELIVKDGFLENDLFTEFFCIINNLDDGYVIHVKHSDMFSNDTAIRFVKTYAEILTQILKKEHLKDIVLN